MFTQYLQNLLVVCRVFCAKVVGMTLNESFLVCALYAIDNIQPDMSESTEGIQLT